MSLVCRGVRPCCICFAENSPLRTRSLVVVASAALIEFRLLRHPRLLTLLFLPHPRQTQGRTLAPYRTPRVFTFASIEARDQEGYDGPREGPVAQQRAPPAVPRRRCVAVTLSTASPPPAPRTSLPPPRCLGQATGCPSPAVLPPAEIRCVCPSARR